MDKYSSAPIYDGGYPPLTLWLSDINGFRGNHTRYFLDPVIQQIHQVSLSRAKIFTKRVIGTGSKMTFGHIQESYRNSWITFLYIDPFSSFTPI
jgi:hypothetical protein